MKKILLLAGTIVSLLHSSIAQNVFNPDDPIIRLDSTQTYGSAAYPNPARTGLQKWVSVPTNSISAGSGAWDASEYKAYYINVSGRRLAFRLRFPHSYKNPDSAGKKYPVWLFFHGAGEPGCPSNGGIYNNEKQLLHGGKLFNERVKNNEFDGFLLYPQVVVTTGCSSSWPTSNDIPVLRILDSLIKYARADVDRVMLAGLSDGGRTTWRFSRAYPYRVSSIAPSAMSAMTSSLSSIIHLPVWFASGGRDNNPTPAQAQHTLNTFTNLGGNIRYTMYPELGHGVWNQHWNEPDFVPYMNAMHKANPLVFFLRDEWCAGAAIAAKLGVSAGFYAYEWQKDGAIIARRTGTTNTIVNTAAVSSYTGNDITVKQYGTYRVRFRRTSSSAWSEWSPKPIVIRVKSITQTAPIVVNGLRSRVLPALDGSTTVPLILAPNFLNYRWYRSTSTTVINRAQVYEAAAGTYRAQYDERYGCGSLYSPNFLVVNANGNPKPAPATQLTGVPASQTSVLLNWIDAPDPSSNETGYEIYRAAKPGGPYQLIQITPENTSSFQDTALIPGTNYYYVVRAVNNTGAAAASNEAGCKTLVDNAAPAAPGGVRYNGSTLRSVSLTWTASTDNFKIKRYDIYVNGIKRYSTTNTSFTVNNLDSLKWYAFTIRAIDASGNSSAPSPQVMGYTHTPGLNYKYYHGSFTSLPDFNTLTPVKTGVSGRPTTGSTIRLQSDDFAFFWEGYVYVPQTANYTLATYSDEGSKLWIDMNYDPTATPVVNNDGIHGPTIAYGLMPLSKGYHRIVIGYFEKTNTENMGVYWLNDAGLATQEIPTNFYTPNPVDGVPPIVAPSDPLATTLAYNKIRLTWTDQSENETGFEILRSLSEPGPYVAAGRTAAGKQAFTDSALESGTTYYYRVRAIGAASESPYTETVSSTTTPAPGSPVAPTGLAAENSTPTFIALSWVDNAANETGIQIWRSTDEPNNFEMLAEVPPNSNSFTDNNVTPYGKYFYYVLGVNINGNGTASETIEVIAGNDAPVMGSLQDMFVNADATASQNFSVTDAGDAVKVTISNRPAFAVIESIGGNNYRLVLTPGTDDIGWKQLEIVATDSKGAVVSKTIAANITDKNTRSVFINLGAAGKTAPAPWNNWLGLRTAGNVINGLTDENNQSTPFTLTTVSGWSGTTVLGHLSGDNSGAAPDAVLESGITDNTTTRQLRFAGLNPSMRYNLVFIGSQNEGLNAMTEYVNGTQRSVMNARYNTQLTANLNGIAPTAGGEILVNATRMSGTLISYLNGIVIEEVSPAATLLQPMNVFAEALNRDSIAVSWSDRTNQENAVDGYEITTATDSLFTMNVVVESVPANTTARIAAGLDPDTRYWFRLRARSGASYSGFSNRASAVTPASTVLVNFNANVTNAPSPWNNTVAQPTSPVTFNNLVNQDGQNSGISMRIEQIFNGEFNAGMNTGNNSGIVPDVVTQANYWLDKTQLSQIRLIGLDQTKRYRVGFIGSSGPQGWFKDNYTATYSVNGKTVYLNSWSNSSKIVYLHHIHPDENGEVLLDFSTTPIAVYGFNAGITIDAYSDGGASKELEVAQNLLLAPLSGEEINTDKKNRIYPNPFIDDLTVEYHQPAGNSKLTALVFDAAGRLVHLQHYNNLMTGMNQLRIRSSALNSGGKAFTVVLAAKGKVVMSKKMIKK